MPAISVFFSRDFTDWNVRGCQQPWVLFLKYYPLLRLFQRIYISWGWDFPTAKKIHLRAYWCLRKSKIFVHSIERHGGTWMHMRYLIRLIFDSFFLKFLKFTTDNFNPRKGLNSRQAELQILPQSWLQVLFIGRVLLSGIWLGSRSVQGTTAGDCRGWYVGSLFRHLRWCAWWQVKMVFNKFKFSIAPSVLFLAVVLLRLHLRFRCIYRWYVVSIYPSDLFFSSNFWTASSTDFTMFRLIK